MMKWKLAATALALAACTDDSGNVMREIERAEQADTVAEHQAVAETAEADHPQTEP